MEKKLKRLEERMNHLESKVDDLEFKLIAQDMKRGNVVYPPTRVRTDDDDNEMMYGGLIY